MMWPYQTPVSPFAPAQGFQSLQQMQQRQIIKVNGRNGADAFAMGPNESALLLDESGLIVWAVTTDGAGYKTVAPYDIAPHRDAPQPDLAAIEKRLKRLEELIHDTGDSAAAERE